MNIKRALLWVIIACLALAALAGIAVVLFDGLFGVEWQIFATIFTFVLFGVPMLAAQSQREQGRWRGVLLAHQVWCAAGLALYLLAIWTDGFGLWRGPYYWWGELLAKMLFTFAVWTIVLPWASMLAHVKLRDAWRWTPLAVVALLFMTAAVINLSIIAEAEALWRIIAVLCILSVLGTIVVPVLARVQRLDRDINVESTPMSLKLTCPRCMTEQTVDAGHSRCGACRLKFHIEIQEPRCPRCNYLLHKLTEPRCPECGQPLGRDEVAGEG